jgi:hypothetical protein
VQTVTLTCDDVTALIYNTMDGSTPTVNSAVYSGPIRVSSSMTLKYFAVNSAGNPSQVYMQNFIINSRQPKEINITNDNYKDYFNVYTGEILADADIIAGDTIRIGNVSNKLFTIDRQLTLTTIAPGNIIKNGVIHLTQGSSGSRLIGLKIVNDKVDLIIDGITVTKLHGIWLTRSNNNYIFNNSVQLANSRGVFAMPMGWSSNNTIIYNTLISTGSTTMPMGILITTISLTTTCNLQRLILSTIIHGDMQITGEMVFVLVTIFLITISMPLVQDHLLLRWRWVLVLQALMGLQFIQLSLSSII